MRLLCISLLALLCNYAISEKALFDNYRVYEISVENNEQMELMELIENYPDGVRDFYMYLKHVNHQRFVFSIVSSSFQDELAKMPS